MNGAEYRAALQWLLSLPDWERGRGTRPAREGILLERPNALLNARGKPQANYRAILVAGTKGKGSTAAMLESILRAAGYKTGLYTSPHLHTYRERIRVDGELISEQAFAERAEEIQALIPRIADGKPELSGFTTFEVMTAMALAHFARAGIDAAILEVGLGGRLDATNVVDADLSLITPISYDHMHILGDTLPKIAYEKAGIIKAGGVALSAPQHADALAVIEGVARERDAILGVGDRDWLWLGGHEDFLVAAEPRAGLWSEYWRYCNLPVPLPGTHQFVNAELAVAAARVIEEKRRTGTGGWRFEIGEDAIRGGLGGTKWAGRLEVLRARDGTQPLIVTDGAHNGDSAEKLFEALKFHFEFDNLFLIVGVLGDKELGAIAMPFAIATEAAWTVKTNHPRAREARDAAVELRDMGIPAQAASNIAEALARAQERASAQDMILITGSLSVVAQARAEMGLAEYQDPDFQGIPSTEISEQ